MWSLVSRSPEETQSLGRRLGGLAQAGDVFLMVGGLGTGKTCLTQGIAQGLRVKEHATSPSFILVNEYKGRFPLYHVDLFRLATSEALELGLDEYFYGPGVSVVEWAERAWEAMPPEHLLIRLDYLGEEERQLTLEPRGQRYQALLAELAEKPYKLSQNSSPPRSPSPLGRERGKKEYLGDTPSTSSGQAPRPPSEGVKPPLNSPDGEFLDGS